MTMPSTLSRGTRDGSDYQERLQRAKSDLEMSQYYEDARKLVFPHPKVDADHQPAAASVRGVHGRRAGHYGSRQSGGMGGR